MPGELGDFSECFLTGTAVEVAPVASIGEVAYAPGRVTQTIMAAYAGAVRPRLAAA